MDEMMETLVGGDQMTVEATGRPSAWATGLFILACLWLVLVVTAK